jgi:cytochrome c
MPGGSRTEEDYGTARRMCAMLAAVLVAGVAALATPAASASAELAAQKNCLGCHHATQRRNGPPLRAIAQRYAKPSQGAERSATLDLLARKIRNGGRGAWGMVPMPSNPQVSEADARLLAAWILDAHR